MNPREFLESIHETEPLLHIQSQQDALSYVDHALSQASPAQIKQLVSTYLGVQKYKPATSSKRKLPRPPLPSKGGGALRMDNRVYDMLAYADSVHDFDEVHVDCLPGLPKEIAPKLFWQTGWENDLIRILSKKSSLHFAGEAVANPTYNARFLDVGFPLVERMTASKHPTFETLFAESLHHTKSMVARALSLIPMDIWTHLKEGAKILKLTQIAELLHVLRLTCGIERKLLVDNNANDYLFHMMFAIQHINHALHKRIVIEELEHVSPPEFRKFIQKHTLGDAPPYTWEVVLTDAGILDGLGAIRYPVDTTNSTGEVFRPGAGYQVVLEKALDTVDPRVQMRWKDGDRTDVVKLTRKEAETWISTNSIREALVAKMMGATVPLQPVRGMTQMQKRLNRLVPYSYKFLYALKRACDWGQVEHCARYKRIFVTRDRLAALYAFARGATCIFVHEFPVAPPFHAVVYRFVLFHWGLQRT